MLPDCPAQGWHHVELPSKMPRNVHVATSSPTVIKVLGFLWSVKWDSGFHSMVLVHLSFMHEAKHLLISVQVICIPFSGNCLVIHFCPFSNWAVIVFLLESVVFLCRKLTLSYWSRRRRELPSAEVCTGMQWGLGAGLGVNNSLFITTAQVSRPCWDLTFTRKSSQICPAGIIPVHHQGSALWVT